MIFIYFYCCFFTDGKYRFSDILTTPPPPAAAEDEEDDITANLLGELLKNAGDNDVAAAPAKPDSVSNGAT